MMTGKKISRSKECAFQIIDGNAIVVQSKKRTVHWLNETATEIWKCLEQDHSIDDLIDSICSEFETTKDEASADVLNFINDMLTNGLIKTI